MAESKAHISIKDGCVDGIDTIKRAKSFRDFILGRGKLKSSIVPILDNINLEIKPGERVAFIGENGSGKSSLLKTIAGIYPMKSGQIDIKGQIAAIIEMGIGFEVELSGRDNIKLAMVYNNILQNYTKELEEEIIEFAELGDRIDQPVKTYSSGMISRLAFSISTRQNADILLLDEVFAAGDEHFLKKAVKRMDDKFFSSSISILVSHQKELIERVCNRCILLENGKIVDDGKPKDILKIYDGRSA